MASMIAIRYFLAEHRIAQNVLLAMLLFGILAKPVLFSLGEMHEIQHDPMAAISHSDLGAEHDESEQSPDHKGSEGSKALHALTHFAHNCDQPTNAETGYFAGLSAALSRIHLPIMVDSPRKSAIPATLFRPPISV